MRTQPRKKFYYPFFTIIILFFCVMIGIAWGVYNLPHRALEMFGKPSPALAKSDLYLYSARLLLARDNLLTPANPLGQIVPFEIEMGESITSIANRLEEAGLVNDADALRNYFIYTGMDYQVQAGKYKLDAGVNSIEVAQSLLDATPTEVEFNILPGWRIEEIAASLPTSGLGISPEAFIAAAYSPRGLPVPRELRERDSLEGFLFPAVYQMPRNITLEQLLSVLTKEFLNQIKPDLIDKFEQNGLGLFQAVTLASMVQREGIFPEEQPLIASVFYNRISNGMKLESDPTVQYALGYNGDQSTWWTNPLTSSDLDYDSLYNTYMYSGFPPGAICNPGYSALQAVAYPAESTFFFFRIRCDNSGYHEFAETYEEHLMNACP